MARMPRGEPRSVPDPAGDLYDQEMGRLKAQREVEDGGLRSPVQVLQDFQNSPDIPRPSTAQSFIPVFGPAWEAAADLQDGNYLGAAGNAAIAVTDVLPVGIAVKGARAAAKGVTVLKKGSVTAGASAKKLRSLGVAKKGDEIHHTIPLNGTGRSVQDWRNHYAFLKVLPQEQHRRLRTAWQGKPRYDPIRRVWYGTTDWMKVGGAHALGRVADTIDNLARPSGQKSQPSKR